MIKVFCDRCSKEIAKPTFAEITSSQHICSTCVLGDHKKQPKKDVPKEHCCIGCKGVEGGSA